MTSSEFSGRAARHFSNGPFNPRLMNLKAAAMRACLERLRIHHQEDTSISFEPRNGWMNQTNAWTDWLGVTASIGCAIHCAAMPLVIAFLPALGLSFLADEGFHQVMVVVCLMLAAVAFVPGWRRHRRWLPVGIASVGLSLIATAAFALEGQCCAECSAETTSSSVTEANANACEYACCELCAASSEATRQNQVTQTSMEAPQTSMETLYASFLPWVTPLGGILLVSAHLTNLRFSCRSGCCPTESEGGEIG